MPDATHYPYRVAWSVEDGEDVATVPEFPSLSPLAPTPVEALAGLANVVREVLADLAASGEAIPEPLSERTYSGRGEEQTGISERSQPGSREAPRPRRKGKRPAQELADPPRAPLLPLARRATRQGHPRLEIHTA
jgi:predicted RNase H-like HicB family nuclease